LAARPSSASLDPPRKVVWDCHGDNPEWVGTTLTWSISPDDDGGSLLRFTQSGWKEMTDMVAGCNSTWGELMHRLKGYAEGKNPGPHWRE
jgi:Activator of Hsp90 ATPase homolog 1-like protein